MIRSLTGESGSREEGREQTNQREISVDISSTERKTEEEISTERITDEVSAERITDEEISAERFNFSFLHDPFLNRGLRGLREQSGGERTN